MDERVPECRDAPASSSRESSVEPVRKEVLPERPEMQDTQENQDHKGSLQEAHRPRAEDALAQPYLEQEILVT